MKMTSVKFEGDQKKLAPQMGMKFTEQVQMKKNRLSD
jgi:hypothetical protein